MSSEIEQLPDVQSFEGMFFDPQSRTVTLQCIPAHKPNTVCQLKFSIQTSSNLTAWLVEMLEQLTGDVEMGRRLQALRFRRQKPKGSA